MPKKNVSAADRLANARDKSSIYAFSQQSDMTEKEREQMRKEMKERFTPGARPMPTSLQGLTSLANERIEDAIARGQFKNIPRGKGANVERDYTASSPFLDTTEYFMNKIIQKQDIVPPWIEKQQELIKMVANFRGRLRNDWRRHAARMISSSGGRVEDHVRKAKAFALTEEILNPRIEKKETLSGISSDGTLVNVTLEERIAAGVIEEKEDPKIEITVTETVAEDAVEHQTDQPITTSPTPSTATSSGSGSVRPMPYPFRDPTWEATERAYHKLAVEEINALARSYNLMAPKIAQKPYYNLDRELRRCFADVAPTLADEILERSRKPNIKIQVIGHKEGGVMERFGATTFEGHIGKVRDEPEERGYGFKEFWRDLFGNEKDQRRNVL